MVCVITSRNLCCMCALFSLLSMSFAALMVLSHSVTRASRPFLSANAGSRMSMFTHFTRRTFEVLSRLSIALTPLLYIPILSLYHTLQNKSNRSCPPGRLRGLLLLSRTPTGCTPPTEELASLFVAPVQSILG